MSVGQSAKSGGKIGVVIAPNWVGDAVMCLPALRALVAAHRDLDWQVAARPQVAGVFQAAGRAAAEGSGEAWATIPLPGRPGVAQLRAVRRMWHQRRPEIAVVLPNSLYSALAAAATGARQRIGYAREGRRAWLRPAIALPAPGSTPPHEAFYYLALLQRAGLIAERPQQATALRAPVAADPAEIAHWRERLAAWPPAPGGGRVAIHAGASFGHAKRWLPERFAQVAGSLAAAGHAVLFIGSRDEAALAEQLAAEARGSGGRAAQGGGQGTGIEGRTGETPAPRGPVVSLAGKTGMEGLLAVLSQCQLLIANDSGPMHLAAALGTPVVAIFGSTNARETHPLAAPGTWRLVQAPGIECSPCKRRECPIDHRCMTRIGSEEVLAAAVGLLKWDRAGR